MFESASWHLKIDKALFKIKITEIGMVNITVATLLPMHNYVSES